MLTIGIGVCLHLAIFPDRLHTIVPVHLCPTTIVVLFTAKTEHLRAGRCIPDSRDGLGIIDVDDVAALLIMSADRDEILEIALP